jgi:hypothetical protein
MGYTADLASVSAATMARLHAEPVLIWAILDPEDPEAVVNALRRMNQPGLMGRLFGRKPPEPVGPKPLELSAGEGVVMDFDKLWHGVHYLLTGSAEEADEPLGFIYSGGTFVGDEEIGLGPPRSFTPAEVRAIADALAKLGDAELRSRYNPDEMMRLEIYPEIWDRDPAEDDGLGALLDAVRELREVLGGVVARGHGLLVINN